MEDIRCDGNIDIHKWQGLPEGMKDWLYSAISACSMKGTLVAIGQSIGLQRFPIVTG
jgi:hypothetical protein